MKLLLLAAAGLLVIAATPAAAQMPPSSGRIDEGPGNSRRDVLGNPSDVGLMSTTPSRLRSSRRELNRGRTTPFEVNMSRPETRRAAGELLDRADIQCEVADALIVARTPDFTPVIEVDCVEGGGLVIADTVPIQATDCLDLGLTDGSAGREESPLEGCRLPGNVATVTAARQSARN
ncbi:hypothetical protein [Brevundimonas viscosa]|uniref:Uncharacterized protein n=1 Tax=Brevundimonas viscosa TaxID=871741 RepID=A0A1I6NQ52_9CAUL|nr:hypothetical protein [Brevundimonas viscosa]SFS30019.1 hypothetical protein SAMN05192570_0323 [Brevundimonas viscosa]